MEHLQIPAGYHSELNLHDTQAAIKTVKDFFQQTLAEQLNLLRVTAPLFVTPECWNRTTGSSKWCTLSPNGNATP